MKSTPLIATITGSIKGADNIEISTSRPLKFWRANARDAGIAKATLKTADKIACITVNLIAAMSDAVNCKSTPP